MTCRSNVQKRLRDMLFTCCCSGDGAENVARGCVRSTLFALHRETKALPMLNEALFEGRNECMVNLIDSHKRTGFIIDKDGGGVNVKRGGKGLQLPQVSGRWNRTEPCALAIKGRAGWRVGEQQKSVVIWY